MHQRTSGTYARLGLVAVLASGCAEDERATPSSAAAHNAQVTEPADASAVDSGAGGSCAPSGCSATAPVPGTVLHDVWIAPDQTVWVVGGNGLVGARAATGEWCWCTPDPTDAWRAVSGAAADQPWVVGAQGRALQLVDGAWRVHSIAPGVELTDVWVGGPNDVYVVGASGLIRHYDGKQFVVEDVAPGHRLNGVWGADAAHVWAVGYIPMRTPLEFGSLPGVDLMIFRRTIDGWLREASWNQGYGGGGFAGIDGSSKNDVWAVGPNQPAGAATGVNMAAHYNGYVWKAVPLHYTLYQARQYSDVVVGIPGVSNGVLIASHGGLGPVRGEDVANPSGGRWAAVPEGPASLLGVDSRGDALWGVGEDVSVHQYTKESGWRRDFGPLPRPR